MKDVAQLRQLQFYLWDPMRASWSMAHRLSKFQIESWRMLVLPKIGSINQIYFLHQIVFARILSKDHSTRLDIVWLQFVILNFLFLFWFFLNHPHNLSIPPSTSQLNRNHNSSNISRSYQLFHSFYIQFHFDCLPL